MKVQLLNNSLGAGIWGSIYLPIDGLEHDVRNNLVIADNGNDGSSEVEIATGKQQIINHNSWDAGLSFSSSELVSVDYSELDDARLPDGSLPDIRFMKLKPSSILIDKGIYVGMPFLGEAPDLGAFECK